MMEMCRCVRWYDGTKYICNYIEMEKGIPKNYKTFIREKENKKYIILIFWVVAGRNLSEQRIY